MKRLYIYMLAIFGIILFSPQYSFAQYCVSGGPSSTFDSNTESVNLLGDAASAISYTGCPAVSGVEDLTASQSVAVTGGASYTADIQFGTCGGNYGNAGEAWIDWNQNTVFDPSESIGTWSGTPPTALSSFAFTVPPSALAGATRMRVMQRENGTLPLDPCGTFSYGSVVDFTVNVTPATFCAAGPTSTFDSNTESVNLIGAGGSAISYTGCPGVTGTEDLTASQSVDIYTGNAYTANIQFGTCGGNYGSVGEAWIDWNQNAVFDPSESIGTWSGTPPTTLSSFTFTVPLGATPGATTMRVMQRENGTLPLDPCGTFSYGSVVDFTVNVSPAPTYCTGGPGSTFDSNIESVNLLGDAASAISYTGCPGVNGVEDLTASQSVDVFAGTLYTADILFGTCGNSYSGAGEAWIDWDKNGVFDPSESIGTWSGTPPTLSSFAFTVPTLGVNGITTMRVMQQESGSLPLDPCASFTWGSVVDFSVNVSGMSLITCPAPTALTATAITATSADFGWTDNALSGIANIEYGAAGFILGTGTLITGTSNNPETVTGLTPETGYEFYVQSDCGLGDFSTWAGPFSFTTPCEAIIAPYTQDFESLALLLPYTALPNCWETQTGPDYWDVTNDLTNGPAWLPNIGDHTTGSGNFMWIDASGDITANEMVSPNIDFSLLTDPIAGFWFASDNTSNAINHTIYLDVWDGSAWVNLTDTIGNFADWIRISAPIPPSIPSTTKFRIQAIANPLGIGSDYYFNDLGVDDFFVLPFCAIEEVAPVADLGSLPDITASCEVVSLTDPTATDNCSAVTVSNDATLPIQVA
ncbi:MAG: GEVED domain-containing protein, partial [Crocinitomicaceae bacterium]